MKDYALLGSLEAETERDRGTDPSPRSSHVVERDLLARLVEADILTTDSDGRYVGDTIAKFLTQVFEFGIREVGSSREVTREVHLTTTSVHTEDVPVEDDVLVATEEPLCTETETEAVGLEVPRETDLDRLTSASAILVYVEGECVAREVVALIAVVSHQIEAVAIATARVSAELRGDVERLELQSAEVRTAT